MSYIIKYERLSDKDDSKVAECTMTVSNQQLKAMRKKPWIKVRSIKKSNKIANCNCLD